MLSRVQSSIVSSSLGKVLNLTREVWITFARSQFKSSLERESSWASTQVLSPKSLGASGFPTRVLILASLSSAEHSVFFEIGRP